MFNKLLFTLMAAFCQLFFKENYDDDDDDDGDDNDDVTSLLF